MNPAFVLKKVSSAHRHLKGISSNIPNQNISIHTLSLQEAKDSSAVENIATHDELFKEKIFPNETRSQRSRKLCIRFTKRISIGKRF
ncbi:Fic/DOC family N-terminal domain-containing protein [Leptospira interrogans]|uniref:Fic/DOC family N-terminal domain-containing protein n=1 Tax=Leptospira interrogans TaxID=173 RepID=UPI0009E426C6|nr:Fic/DOC family N-terminal domain-containing protein [Leptospira interrogans]